MPLERSAPLISLLLAFLVTGPMGLSAAVGMAPSPLPEAMPGAPTSLVATAGDGLVNLTWETPMNDGGYPITACRVKRGVSPEYLTQIAEVGPVLDYTDSTVINGVTYYYRVSAVNQDGEGNPSIQAVATPMSSGGGGNAAPTAFLTLTPQSGGANKTFFADASGSSDAEDPLETIEVWWDWGDDGIWGTSWTTVKTAQHQCDTPGTYTIHLEARGTLLETASVRRDFTVFAPSEEDTTPPTASITSPEEGAVLNATSVTVTGTASDDVAVAMVEVSLDGMNWMVATGTTSWSADLTLSAGQNTIRVRATDTSGNQVIATVAVTVDLDPGDGSHPADLLPGGLLTFIGVAVALVGLGLLAFLVWRGRSPGKPP